MARVVQFRSPRRNGSSTRRRQWRLLNAPWLPLAGLIGVAGVLWLGAAQYPNRGMERHLDSVVGTGTLANSGSGSFLLCAGTPRPNCVIDGDTIRYGGLKIRLADIDAPEVFSPKCASEAARGERATRRLLELMNAGPFELVRNGAPDEDRYGRKLRVIERAGRSIGNTLIAEGLECPWDGARRSWCE